ncbi:Cytochrome c oxidase assembly factor 4-like protein, mitochondrial [Trichoplax sp. H2]|nr:Cytochrome c oxidase assembly factor 4-like protein, mitochondrial [Trichoplax sp. H2]|eukprot:RDD42992.1 Cytochrome c oxidase assembly factor 4-like protein, mitochondrial [Trichoplax sp. H2]
MTEDADQSKRPSHHWNKSKQDDDEEKDPFEIIIEKSGCSAFHYALQDCMFENRDWRKCKEEMKSFKDCMDKSVKHAKSRSN